MYVDAVSVAIEIGFEGQASLVGCVVVGLDARFARMGTCKGFKKKKVLKSRNYSCSINNKGLIMQGNIFFNDLVQE